jgi:hypothetical protein
MGIRFSCHLCNHPLHVKDYQAGKRGKCPKCQGAFRVPSKDSDFSLAFDESAASLKPAAPEKSLSASDSGTIMPMANPPAGSKAQKPPASLPQSTPAANTHPTMPASLLPLIDSRWYVRPPSGGQFGPATTQMLLDWIAEKRVTADALLWREGLDSWLSARELVPESFGGTSAPSDSDVPPPAVARPTNPVAPSANTKVAVAVKKKKQVKRQWMILGFLATMALCLASALIVILTRSL